MGTPPLTLISMVLHSSSAKAFGTRLRALGREAQRRFAGRPCQSCIEGSWSASGPGGGRGGSDSEGGQRRRLGRIGVSACGYEMRTGSRNSPTCTTSTASPPGHPSAGGVPGHP